MTQAEIPDPMKWMSIEGILLGLGLIFIVIGGIGVFVPLPPTMPMGVTISSYGATHQSFTQTRYDIPIRMLPTQFVQVTVRFNEESSDDRREVAVFARYWLIPLWESMLFRAINESEVSFVFGWKNVSQSNFPSVFFLEGFKLIILYEGRIGFTAETVIYWFGDFTYFAGLTLIVISAIPLWGYYFLMRKRKRMTRELDSRIA